LKIKEEDMEYEETYVAGELEIWLHTPTGRFYAVPIKITRYFEEAYIND